MGKGSSSSSSSQATTSDTTDIAAQSSGIALGPGASYVNDLSDNAVSVISKIVDFSGGVLQQAQQIISDAQASAAAATLQAENLGAGAVAANSNTTAAALATATQSVNNSQLGQSAIFTNPAFLIAGVVAIGLIVYIAIKRRN